MMKTLLLLALAVAAIAGATLVHGRSVESASLSTFEVLIPSQILDEAVSDPDPNITNIASFHQRINAYVDGVRCATANLVTDRDSNGDILLVLGTPEQPAACARDGATVTFTVGPNPRLTQERTLTSQLTLRIGSRETLDRLAVVPPHTGDAGYLGLQRDNRTFPTLSHALLGLAVAALGTVGLLLRRTARQ